MGTPFGNQRRGERSATPQAGSAFTSDVLPTATRIGDIILYMVSRALGLTAVAAMLLSGFAAAQTITDGNTIKLNGTTYRLWGIDAPEMRQACADGWEAGPEARRKLADLIGVGHVTCESRGLDRYRRTIALCRTDGQDLGAAMVSAGMAYAFTRYSGDYVEQEKSAILSRAGVHAHDCEKPWDWRARNRVDR
jgi:endonuclease YncB( thermonuclease family)